MYVDHVIFDPCHPYIERLPTMLSLGSGCVGELASHERLFNPPPQFSRLGTQSPALVL